MRRKWAALITFLLLTVLLGSIGLWLRAQQRQYALNRQLIASVERQDDKQALALVNEGADPNTHSKPTPVPSLKQLWNQLLHRSSAPVNHSRTALMIACGAYRSNDYFIEEDKHETLDATQLVQAMLSHGANVNVLGEAGMTPLQWAILRNRRNTVGILLEYGANVNTRDDDNRTPMSEAIELPKVDIVRLLIEHGADVNWKDMAGRSLLEDAVETPAIARLLLEHGANVNAKANDGITPLMQAIQIGDANTVQLMIEHRADVNLRDKEGNTALYYVVSEMQETDSDKNHPSQDYIRERKVFFRQLLAHGANPNLPNKNGETALTLAQHIHRPDYVALLRHYGARK